MFGNGGGAAGACVGVELMDNAVFGCKEYNQSDFGVDHLVMSMWSLLLCCWKRVFAMTSVF